MGPAPLHAIGRHRPELRRQVDFIPPGADRFAGPGGGQDGELERPGGRAVPLAQLDHEGGRIGIGERGMMLDLAHLAPGRQQLVCRNARWRSP